MKYGKLELEQMTKEIGNAEVGDENWGSESNRSERGEMLCDE